METNNTTAVATVATTSTPAAIDFTRMNLDTVSTLIGRKVTDKSVKASIASLRRNGGFISGEDIQSTTVSAVAVAADTISQRVLTAGTAMRDAAILAGYIDKSGAWALMHDAKGKPYGSTNQLFADILPHLNKGTISRLVDAGKLVYIPALEGNADGAINAIAGMSPSMLKGVLPSLKDEQKRPAMLSAISTQVDACVKADKALTSRNLDAAAASLRGKAKETKEPTTGGASQSDIDAQLKGDMTAPAVKRYFATEVIDDEIRVNVAEQNVPNVMELLKKVSTDKEAALQFTSALYAQFEQAIKRARAEK